MTLIGWLIALEIIVSLGLVIWYVHRAHRHVKHSPAEKALEQHLAELEAAAAAKDDTSMVSVKVKKAKK